MKTVHSASQAETSTSRHSWGTLTWLASRDLQNTDHTAMAYVVIEKGQQNPRHRHNACAELLHLIRGELDHTVGDEHFHLSSGDTINIPAGVFHNAVNTGGEDAHMIVVYSTAERDFELESDYLQRMADTNA